MFSSFWDGKAILSVSLSPRSSICDPLQQNLALLSLLSVLGQLVPELAGIQWSPIQGGFRTISDLAIFSAYMAIATALIYFVKKLGVFAPFKWVFYVVITFLTLCAITLLTDAVNLWTPIYGINAFVFAATAGVSVLTVFGLLRILPEFMKLESPEVLKAQIAEKTFALEHAHRELEHKVCAMSQRMREAQAVAGLGFWDMDLA